MMTDQKQKNKMILCGSIDADIGETFRERVGILYGPSKGVIGKALQEAVEAWVKDHPAKRGAKKEGGL